MSDGSIVRLSLLSVLVSLFAMSLFARGTPEDAWEEAEGTEHWSHEIDLTDFEPGRYNLIVRGLDRAGNETVVDPIDLKIDPDAFVPTASFIAPEVGQVIRDEVNVVGGVSYRGEIESVEVRLNESEWQAADGAEFWAKSFNPQTLDDGVYTVEVRATGAGDRVGPVSRRTFVFDRDEPEIGMASHAAGAIVSGEVSIEGWVSDAHEIERLYLRHSVDGVEVEGENAATDEGGRAARHGGGPGGSSSGAERPFSERELLRLRFDSDEQRHTFSYEFDSSELSDGIMLIELEAENVHGGRATTVVPLLVHNDPPEFEVLTPDNGAATRGETAVAGYVRSQAGVSRLWYELDGEEVDIELVPGNRYWHFALDTSERSEREIDVLLHAEDELGNRSRRTLQLENARDRSRPRIVFAAGGGAFGLLENGDSVLLRRGATVSGAFTEGAPGDQLMLRGEDGAEATIDAYPGGFTLSSEQLAGLAGVDALAPGDRLTLALRGVRANGIEGAERELSITVIGDRPEIDFDFEAGVEVTSGEDFEITGRTFTPAGRSEIALEITLPDGTSLQPDPSFDDGEAPFSEHFEVDIDGELLDQTGEATIALTIIDEAGDEHTARTSMFLGNRIFHAEEELLRFADERVADDGTIVLDDERPLVGRFLRDLAVGVEMEGADGIASISVAEKAIVITPELDGRAEDVTIRVQLPAGREYVTEPFDLIVSRERPVLDAAFGPSDRFVAEGVAVEGSVESGLGALSGDDLRYELFGVEADDQENTNGAGPPAGTFELLADGSIEVSEAGSFTFEIDFREVSGGPGSTLVRLTAEDALGRLTTDSQSFLFDPDEPQWKLVSPDASLPVYGVTSVSGIWSGNSPLDLVEWRVDEESWQELDVLAHQYDGEWPLLSVYSVAPIDFTEFVDEAESLQLRATNVAGGITVVNPGIVPDLGAGRPTVEVQLPEENELIVRDGTLTGFAADDDGIAAIYWRLGDGEFEEVSGERSFSIPLPVSALEDNEQRIEVYAEDIYGLESERVVRSFRVSTASPSVEYQAPMLEETVAGVAELSGTAYDENGIEEILLSFDGGNSFHSAEVEPVAGDGADAPDATGEPNGADQSDDEDSDPPPQYRWRYDLDTRLFVDGPSPVHIRAIDSYGVESERFSIINIDNTKPELALIAPYDRQRYSGELAVRGRVSDNIAVTSVTLALDPLDGQESALEQLLSTEEVLHESVDISELEPGRYAMRVTATDPAGNERTETREVAVTEAGAHLQPELIVPGSGARHAQHVDVFGSVGGDGEVTEVAVHVDGVPVGQAHVSRFGYFSYRLDDSELSEGQNTVHVSVVAPSGEMLESARRTVRFSPMGPAISIESHEYGEPVADRPWIEGVARYAGVENESTPTVEHVEVSLDSGATFESTRGGEQWRYRLPTHELQNGPVSIVVRAEFEDGSRATTRGQLIVDNESPVVALRAPADNETLADSLRVVGTASDNHSLSGIEVALREGRSGRYSVPAFIQGMYVDAHTLGVTYADVGIGFTFFDDNVRLQGQYGVTPSGQRFSGQVVGGKLLANIASVPFSTFFGPDWEFLSANFALGANFSYIALSEPLPGSDAPGVVLSAILGQFEFPRVDIAGWDILNSYSLYTEPQIWFVPSDVEPAIEARMSFGMRIGLF